MRSSAPSFNFQYLLVFLRSSSSCLRLLPRLPISSILLSIFHSTACFRRLFLCKTWQIKPVSFFTLLNFSHDQSNWSSLSFFRTIFKKFQVFLIYFTKCSIFNTLKLCYICSILLISKSNLLVKRVFLLLNAAFFYGNPGLNFTWKTLHHLLSG